MNILKAGLMAALMAGAQPATADTTIVFNNFLAPNDALWTDVMLPWIADVEKVTEGRVKFTEPAASLAPPPELLNAVQQGVADGAFQMVGFLRAAHPELQLPLLPMTCFGNFGNEETSVALWRTYEAFFKGKNDLKDVELLGLVTTPGNSLVNMKPAPFQSVADLKGVKMWSLPGIPAETLTALGAVVDAFCCINCESLEVFNDAQYIGSGTYIPGRLFAPAFAVFVRSDVFGEIGAEDQAAIRAVSGEVFARRGAFGDPVEAAARERLAASGKTVRAASNAFVAELETAVEPVIAAWVAATAARGIDGQAALDFHLAQQDAVRAGN